MDDWPRGRDRQGEAAKEPQEEGGEATASMSTNGVLTIVIPER